MNKAVFLDRDGTINVDYGYVHEYEKFDFIDGVTDTLKALQQAGYLLIVITNQSGIARGYYTEEDLNELHKKVCKDLEDEGIHITQIYYCPHLTGCTCRKPQLGMFYQAAREHNIDMSRSIAIGDNLRDLEICKAEEVEGFWITESDEEVAKRVHKVQDIREVISLLKGMKR